MTYETEKTRGISNDEILRDIDDTKAEIRDLEKRIEAAQRGINERKDFIMMLRGLLEERMLARECHAAGTSE